MEATSFRTYQVLWFLYLFSNFIVHNFHQIDLFPILEFAAIALFLKKHRSIQLSFSVLLFCPNGSVYVSLLKFRLYMIEIEAQDNFFDMCILLITCHLSLSINCKLALCHWEFVWTLCNHRQGGAESFRKQKTFGAKDVISEKSDFRHLNGLSRDEVISYFKSEISKLKRMHESALQEKDRRTIQVQTGEGVTFS